MTDLAAQELQIRKHQEVPMLELRSVSASYGPYRALFNVSFSIPQGSAMALVGSNGAGKSTLARVVSGLVPISDGQVLFDGVDISNFSAVQIARLGVLHITEGRSIFSTLTVEDNLVLSFKKLLGRRESKEALEAAYIGFPWLRKRRKQIAGTLSGGEQRMLSLAKVFAFSPKLLVADELSFGLAPIVVEEVFQLLERIKLNGITLMIIEQHLDKLLQLADILGLLKKGEIVDYGPLETLKSKLIQL